ncbi:MAG: YveK family protein [Beutenbergiaceae bacterium]
MPRTWTLNDVLRAIGRGWKSLVVALVVCLAASVAAYQYFPQQYEAIAVHTVEPISALSAGSSFNTVNMQTEQVVATSRAVMDAAVETLGDGATASELAQATTVEVPRNSQVLRFLVTGTDPERAANWANAIATAYGEQRSSTAQEVVERTREELAASITSLREQLQAAVPGSPDAGAISLQLEASIVEQARLESTPFFAGSLITPASPPQDSTRPAFLIFLAAGVALGLLVGCVIALAVADGRKRSNKPAEAPVRHAVSPFPPVRATVAANQAQPVSSPERSAATARSASSPRERSAQPVVRTGKGLPARLRRTRPDSRSRPRGH